MEVRFGDLGGGDHPHVDIVSPGHSLKLLSGPFVSAGMPDQMGDEEACSSWSLRLDPSLNLMAHRASAEQPVIDRKSAGHRPSVRGPAPRRAREVRSGSIQGLEDSATASWRTTARVRLATTGLGRAG